MKKITMALLALLLVLAIGQSAFAKGSINLGVGYNKMLDSGAPSGVSIKLDGYYYFTDNFSLAAGFGVNLYFIPDGVGQVYSIELFSRYDLLKTSVTTIGLQFGLIDRIIIPGLNILYVGPGAYAKFRVGSKTNIYADIKLPIGGAIAFVEVPQFVSFYVYNITLGATYEITSNINVGVEANVNNVNIGIPDFSIRAKLGYNF